jgi:hypothetical protein
MQKIPFFSLERSIQDRFIESTHGKEVPNPLLYQKAPQNPLGRAFAIVALVVLASGLVFAWLGFGKLDHRWAIDPRWTLFVYCGLACLALLTLLRAILIWDRDASLPFLRGVFVYPVGVIDARSEVLVVHEFNDLVEHSVAGAELRLRFKSGASFEFIDKDKARLEHVHASVVETQQRLSLPPAALSQREHVLLNPLMDTGFRNPFGSIKPLLRETPAWGKFWILIALAIGLPMGVGIFQLRNVLSEKQLYVKARRLDSTAAYRNYLQRGGSRSEVTELLLPRAELRDARATQSVATLEDYLDAHPNSKIRSEIEAALRVQLLTELEKARDKESLSALHEFRDSVKHIAVIQPELEATEKSLFRIALGNYLSTTPASAEQQAFFTRLLEYTRTHGPKVEVRFRRQVPTDAIDRSEVQLKKSAYYAGPAALPSQYFSSKYAEPRESSIAKTLSERCAQAFPKDILTFELGPALEDESNTTPTVQAPTLVITHRTELSGVFLSRKPRGAFVGLSLQYKARLLIPGEAATLDFQTSSWLAPNSKKLEEAGLSYRELYETMAREGFSRFLKRYLPTLFGSPKAPADTKGQSPT